MKLEYHSFQYLLFERFTQTTLWIAAIKRKKSKYLNRPMIFHADWYN